MNRSFLFKKRLMGFGSIIIEVIATSFKRLIQIAFAKRTVMFVTNEKIRTVNLGPLPQLALVFFIAWVINLFNQSLRYNEIIDEKSQEISRLKHVNSTFEEEFESMSDKLRKINEYLTSITGAKRNASRSEDESSLNNNLNNSAQEALTRKEKLTIEHINNGREHLASIQDIARERTKKIESVINLTGLNIKKSKNLLKKFNKNNNLRETSLNNPRDLFRNQGGPQEHSSIDNSLPKSAISNSWEDEVNQMQFTGEIDYLMVLEKLVKSMPLGRPMKNYYISSGFGVRVDPITHKYTQHSGLDFVGVSNEKVISPSSGKVILAGRYSEYGNAVVIDHGYGITTRYGHLSSIKVKEGDVVKEGQVIAFQGNTGRSTGAHLHYEVRYKNIPLNPRKFLEAGFLLNNDSKPKYVNS